MGKRIVLDSSILVEYRKGTKTDLLQAIAASSAWIPCIGQVAVSEYLYYHLAIFSGKSPRSVQSAKEVNLILGKGWPSSFLEQFEWLTDSPRLVKLSVEKMSQYQLLPNDALILASCLVNDITHLASYDNDFANACAGEGISLIHEVRQLG